MFAIYKREIRAYFTSPIGFIFVAVFLGLAGFLFSLNTVQNGGNSEPADVSTYFTLMLLVFVIIIPLLTMKLFSEERKSKTDQLLLTAPVNLFSIVCAKFFAAYTIFAGTFLISCLNMLVLSKYGSPNAAILFGYIIGILLIGAAFTAIGVFVSSLTENQLIAAIGTIAILLILLGTSFLNQYIDFYPVRAVLNWLSVYNRFGSFSYGIFDFSALLYYFSIVVIFLFLTVRVFEKRRWE